MTYFLRRLLYAVPIALGVTIICFSLIYLGPVEPLDAVAPDDASPEELARLKVEYGFDKPLPVQYLIWLGRAAGGDFGVSLFTRRPVIEELLPAISNTMMLAMSATGLAFSIAFALGILAAYNNGRILDRLFTGVAVVGVSIPNYWLSIVLIMIFAVELNMLPAMGMGPTGSRDWAWDVAHLRHMILPAIAISAIPVGIITRTTRACILEMLSQEFVSALHAKGISRARVLVHVVRNAAPTVLAATGIQFGHLLGGSILVETVFSWTGTGYLLNEAIFKRDLPILQATIAVLALFFVAINLVVDLVQTWLDPRIRRT
ncbi:MAG: ABC transporter permease [Rhodospirillales bacterium]|nr:ABC transporter permease [Rhodospirillales bacterium]